MLLLPFSPPCPPFSYFDNDPQSQAAESIADKLQNLKKNEKERKEKIRRGKKEIEKLQEMLDNPPEMENLDDIAAEIVRFSSPFH